MISPDTLLESRVGEVTPRSLRRLDPDHLADHVDRLFRAAWALCGDPHDAEDLVQETYARVLSRTRFMRRDDDLVYLLQVLRNTHISRLRHDGRRIAEVPLDEETETAPAQDLGQPEFAFEVAELFSAIAGLPEDSASALVAVDVVGLSYREAAKALGIKQATLTTRLHRARRRVVRALGSERSSSRA